MRLRSARFCAGFRLERFRSSGIFDLHEVAYLPQHTGELRALPVLRGAPDLAQPERAERAAMPLALADLAADLGDLDLATRHRTSSSSEAPSLRSQRARRPAPPTLLQAPRRQEPQAPWPAAPPPRPAWEPGARP